MNLPMRDPILINAPMEQVASPKQAIAYAMAIAAKLRAFYEQVANFAQIRGMPEAGEAALALAEAQMKLAGRLRPMAGESGSAGDDILDNDVGLPQEVAAAWEDAAGSALATPYRFYGLGVDDAMRGFVYFSHLAAHAEHRETQTVLELLADGQLELARSLRSRRRMAYHAKERWENRQQMEIASLDDLRFFLSGREEEIGERLSAVRRRLSKLGEASIVDVLDGMSPAGAKGESKTGNIGDDHGPVELLVFAQQPLERLAVELQRMLPHAGEAWRAAMERALDDVAGRLTILSKLIDDVLEARDPTQQDSPR